MIKRVEIVVSAVTDAANKKLDAVLARKADIAKPVSFDVDANITAALAELESLKSALGAERGGEVPITLSAELNKASLAKAEAAARVFVANSKGVTLPVYADMSKVSFERVEATAKLLTSQPLTQTINFDANTASLMRSLGTSRAEADAANAAGGGGGGRGWLGGLGRVALFGGLTSISGLHLLMDAIVEVGSVLIPATIAFAAFGIAGYKAADAIYTHTENALTAIQAVGGSLPALSTGFSAVENSVKPQVMTIWGMALEAINTRTSAFGQLATGAGNALEQFGMRALEAWKSASASGFAAKAVGDLQTVLHIVGNVGGIIGNLLHTVLGVGGALFNVLNTVTLGLEHITSSGAVQGLLKVGLGFHGIFIYAGLLATGLIKLWPLIEKAGSMLTTAGLNVASWGENVMVAARAGEGFDGVMAAMGLGAAGAAGVIAGTIAVVAAVAYMTNEASDATANWINKINANVNAQTTLGSMIKASAAASSDFNLKAATLSSTLDKNTTAFERNLIAVRHGGGEYGSQVRSINELSSAQKNSLAEFVRLSSFQNVVASRFGMSTKAVSTLVLQMTGSKKAANQFWQALASGKTSTQSAVDQIAAYELATTGMVPTTEKARAALYALQTAGGDAAQGLQKVTSAEDQLMGLSSGLESAQLNISGNLHTLAQDAKKSGASFTGLNTNSIALQQEFESNMLPTLQQVKDGLLNAHASAHDMAKVIATDLVPAVNIGILRNKAFRDQIYDLAKEAGYQGVDSIRALTGWIDRNRESAGKADTAVRGLAGSIGKIPKNWHSSINISGNGSWHMAGAAGPAPLHDKGVPGGLSSGGRLAGYGGGDRRLALLEDGEAVVPKHLAGHPLIAGVLKAHGVPGYTSGGYVAGDYHGIAPNWPLKEWNASLHSMENTLAKSFSSSLASLGAGAVSGNVAGWITAALHIAHAPTSWLGILERLVSLESGGNARAVNPISVGGQHASGLFQTLGSTFATYGLGGSMFNPIADAVAGIRYIMARYGTPFAIPGLLSGGYHGYANGGWVKEPVFGMGLHSGHAYSFGERGPEYVSPNGGGGDIYVIVNASHLVNPDTMGKEIVQAINTYAHNHGGRTGMVGTTYNGQVVKR